MHRLRAVGTALSVLALAGYTVGVAVDYPGRAFSIALFMVGATLVVVGGAHD
jgi:hypothetical protein